VPDSPVENEHLDEFLTVYDVAQRLKVNQQTVRNWIDRGELVGVRIGSRRVRIPANELERFISESSAARIPTEDSAREAYTEALKAVQATRGTGANEAKALRQLARTSTLLARILSP
jgi:excisionase family DNA binding protein